MTTLALSRFRPALVPTLAALGAFVVLIGLGTWQVQRMQWKNDLIARIDARMAGEPVDLPASIDAPAAWEYRRVRVEGTFRHEAEMPIAGRTWANKPGWHVVTPLVRSDGGGTVLVNRGFVLHETRDPASRAAGQVPGVVTVEGLVRVPGRVSWLQPDNRPQQNTWFWYDIPAMARHAGIADAAPVIVEAGPAPNPGGQPVGGQTVVNIPNDHLNYALTWYGLAAALLVMWAVGSYRRDDAATTTR